MLPPLTPTPSGPTELAASHSNTSVAEIDGAGATPVGENVSVPPSLPRGELAWLKDAIGRWETLDTAERHRLLSQENIPAPLERRLYKTLLTVIRQEAAPAAPTQSSEPSPETESESTEKKSSPVSTIPPHGQDATTIFSYVTKRLNNLEGPPRSAEIQEDPSDTQWSIKKSALSPRLQQLLADIVTPQCARREWPYDLMAATPDDLLIKILRQTDCHSDIVDGAVRSRIDVGYKEILAFMGTFSKTLPPQVQAVAAPLATAARKTQKGYGNYRAFLKVMQHSNTLQPILDAASSHDSLDSNLLVVATKNPLWTSWAIPFVMRRSQTPPHIRRTLLREVRKLSTPEQLIVVDIVLNQIANGIPWDNGSYARLSVLSQSAIALTNQLRSDGTSARQESSGKKASKKNDGRDGTREHPKTRAGANDELAESDGKTKTAPDSIRRLLMRGMLRREITESGKDTPLWKRTSTDCQVVQKVLREVLLQPDGPSLFNTEMLSLWGHLALTHWNESYAVLEQLRNKAEVHSSLRQWIDANQLQMRKVYLTHENREARLFGVRLLGAEAPSNKDTKTLMRR